FESRAILIASGRVPNTQRTRRRPDDIASDGTRGLPDRVGCARMRVVHLTTEFPWPATSGGPVRTLSQLRITASLPEVDAITLLSVAEHPVPAADVRALAQSFATGPCAGKLHVVPPVFHPIHLFDFKRRVPRVVALRLAGVPYLAG